MSQETGDQIHVEFVQRFENDIGMFLDEVDTEEEKMAKIEQLKTVIDIMQSSTHKQQMVKHAKPEAAKPIHPPVDIVTDKKEDELDVDKNTNDKNTNDTDIRKIDLVTDVPNASVNVDDTVIDKKKPNESEKKTKKIV